MSADGTMLLFRCKKQQKQLTRLDDTATDERVRRMDLVLRNVRLAHRPEAGPVDIGVAGGKIVAIEKNLAAQAETYDAGGRLACGGLIETHIHLDKSRIVHRTPPETGRKISPMKQVGVLKSSFT